MTGQRAAALAVVTAVALGFVRVRAQAPAAPSAQTPPPATGTAFILGRAVDAVTGDPVDDAMVELIEIGTSNSAVSALLSVAQTGSGKLAAPPRRVLVNGHGQFVFHDLPAGAILISATAPGYMPSGPGVEVPGGAPFGLDIRDGQHLADVTIRMWRLSSIEGTVVDESGGPMAEVEVRLLSRSGGARLVGGGVTTTDDRGVFRFAALVPGRYYVLIQSTTSSMPASVVDDYATQLNENVSPLIRGPDTAAPHPGKPGVRVGDTVYQPTSTLARDAPPPAKDGSLLIYRTTFYPTAPTVSQAQPIDLAAGDDRTDVNLMVPLVHTVAVSGTMTSATGSVDTMMLRLVPAETASWARTDGLDAAWTTTDENGAFRFLGVPPGQYVVENEDNVGWVRSTLTVGDTPVSRLSLTEHPKLRVSGQVRFAASGIGPSPALGPGTLSLVSLSGRGQQPPVMITPDGRFTLEGCDPGTYLVDARSIAVQGTTWTLQSITSNGHDLSTQPLDLEADASDVIVTYTDRPTEISGSVGDASASADALVVVVFPADYQAAQDSGIFGYRTTTAAVTSGRFVVDGLPSGRYLVAAVRAAQLGIWQNPNPLAKLASQASPVTLTDRAHLTVDLKVVDLR